MSDSNSGDVINFSLEDEDISGIVIEQDGIEGGVARGEEALSILENKETRNFFLDDVYEVSYVQQNKLQ